MAAVVDSQPTPITQALLKETTRGNYLDRHFGSVTAGRAPDVAVQRRLGILPKRRPGTGAADCGDPRADRPSLTRTKLLTRRAFSRATTWNRSFVTFFRVCLNQALGQDHQGQNLGPLGENVADDLSPFRFWVHVDVDPNPANTGHQEKQRQRMISYGFRDGALQAPRWFSAFDGTAFVEILRSQHRDYHSRPVRNGVPKKRAPVGLRIGYGIKHRPKNENTDRRYA